MFCSRFFLTLSYFSSHCSLCVFFNPLSLCVCPLLASLVCCSSLLLLTPSFRSSLSPALNLHLFSVASALFLLVFGRGGAGLCGRDSIRGEKAQAAGLFFVCFWLDSFVCFYLVCCPCFCLVFTTPTNFSQNLRYLLASLRQCCQRLWCCLSFLLWCWFSSQTVYYWLSPQQFELRFELPQSNLSSPLPQC